MNRLIEAWGPTLVDQRQQKQARILIQSDGFSSIPHGQFQEQVVLLNKGPRAPYSEALKVISQNRAALAAMANVYEAEDFVSQKVFSVTGKLPVWHNWNLSD